jgi:RND family efflux transporter MFP subunit
MKAGGDTSVKLIASSVTLAAAMLTIACGSSKPDLPRDRPAVAIPTARVLAEELAEPFEAGGVVRPLATASIASRVLSTVTAVHVSPGDRVRRGSRLVTLDAREMAAANDRARASLTAAAEAVRAAEADIRSSASSVTLARATRDRIGALHAKRSATPQELDEAVAAALTADAQLAAAQARLASAQAARDAAAAAADGARVAAGYGLLAAPFDGLITGRAVDPGSMALPGVTLLTLEDPSKWRLEVQIDEARAAFVTSGQTVDVYLDRDPADAPTPGRVVEVARLDPVAHNYLVKVELPAQGHYRSGLFGRVRIPGARRRTLTIPASSLVRRGQLTFVFAVADGIARLRPVQIGVRAGQRVEILGGLGEGDTVADNPPPALADGTRVVAAAAREAGR